MHIHALETESESERDKGTENTDEMPVQISEIKA